MSTRYGFFDAVSGDRVYSSTYFDTMLKAMKDGVVAFQGNELKVEQTTVASMVVNVKSGIAFVQGKVFEQYGTDTSLTIAAAHATLYRIDRIIIDIDYSARTAVLAVLQGTPAIAGTQVAPTLTQNAGVRWQHSIAEIAVNEAVTNIPNSAIYNLKAVINTYPVVTALPTTILDKARCIKDGIEYFWDVNYGGRWLSSQLFKAVIPHKPGITYPITVTAATPLGIAQLENSLSIWVESCIVGYSQAATFDGSNNWQISLRRFAAGVGTSVGAITTWTAGYTAGTFYTKKIDVNVTATPANALSWYIQCDKTGTPGGLTLEPCIVNFRLGGS
jgi:hypothetical protein